MQKSPKNLDTRKVETPTSIGLGEARRCVEIVQIAMGKSGFEVGQLNKFATHLKQKEEQLNQQKSSQNGQKIKPRSNVRHSLIKSTKRLLFYIDESGVEQLVTNVKNNCFSLSGIAMTAESESNYIANANRIKEKFLGTTDTVFHEPQMRNRSGQFKFKDDSKVQGKFDEAIKALIKATEFVAFSAVIRKDEFKGGFFGSYLPADNYALAITLLLEQFVEFLCQSEAPSMGRVIFESQLAHKDALHQAAHTYLLLNGTQSISDKTFRDCLEIGCHFHTKSGSSGTELADLVARECFEWVRSDCKEEPKFWNELKTKWFNQSEPGPRIFPPFEPPIPDQPKSKSITEPKPKPNPQTSKKSTPKKKKPKPIGQSGTSQ